MPAPTPFGVVREQISDMRRKALSDNAIAARMGDQALAANDAIKRTESITPQTRPLRDKAALLRAYHALYRQAAGELDGRLPATDLTRKE